MVLSDLLENIPGTLIVPTRAVKPCKLFPFPHAAQYAAEPFVPYRVTLLARIGCADEGGASIDTRE